MKRPPHRHPSTINGHLQRPAGILALLALLIWAVFCAAGVGWTAGLNAGDPKEPWKIQADEISVDEQNKVYTAKGNALIYKTGRRLTADFVTLDQKNNTAAAAGNVLMVVGEDTLSGSRMDLNLKDETGTVTDGTLFLKKNHFYIKGHKIHKIGPNTYMTEKATLTACDGDVPAWKLTGKTLKVTEEEYGYITHAALWAKELPVAYAPVLFFPAKRKRQTGFLTPQFAYSDRNGTEYNQPFFWAIDDHSDATFYAHWIQHRGTKTGAEYRYMRDEVSQGAVMFDYLEDRKVDDGDPKNADFGYDDDGNLRPNSDRYWFRMKVDQKLPGDFFARLDLDVVSDQDYLTEFREGYSGFEDTELYFTETFGRELDDYNDAVRENRLNLNRSWSRFSLNIEAQWNDDVVSRRWQDDDTTLQHLPLVEFDGSKQPILESDFYYSLDSELQHFYRIDGMRGQRIDIYPRWFYPYKFRNFFSFEPSVGLRGTSWYIYDNDRNPAIDEEAYFRYFYDLKLDLSSEVYRVYAVDLFNVDKIKWSIRPQVVYDWQPVVNQDDLPSFDGLDRIGEQSRATYSITHTFVARTANLPTEPETEPTTEPETEPETEPKFEAEAEPDEQTPAGEIDPSVFAEYSYREFGRFKLEQSYDFLEAKKADDPRPFSNITADLEFSPIKYFTLDADASWSVYENLFTAHNAAATLSDKRGDHLTVEYRFTKDSSETLYTDILLKITDRLWSYSEYERNILEGEDIKFGAGLVYMSQCWAIDVGHMEEENDIRRTVMVHLYGLGTLGDKFVYRRFKNPYVN